MSSSSAASSTVTATPPAVLVHAPSEISIHIEHAEPITSRSSFEMAVFSKSKNLTAFYEENGTNNSPGDGIDIDSLGVSSPVQEELRKLSSQPFTMSWHHLDYTVEQKVTKKVKVKKQLLFDICGVAKPTEMVAIMGTSGAGKTTMLNVLAGRNINGEIGGKILVNGLPRTKLFKKQTAYVEQDDILFPNLTVRETFTFTALLRLPNKMQKKDKIQRAMDVIRQLGLSLCIDTRIGNAEQRGVSGGERKRVAIGVELITNPRILFLDEPTSGLDAFTAFHIMKSVRQLAKGGRVVVCTIHQPRSNIYALFDKLLLLAQGRTVYFGPAADAVDFFSVQRFPCPVMTNPPDHFLDITTIDTRTQEAEAETRARVKSFCEAYDKSLTAEKEMGLMRQVEDSISSNVENEHLQHHNLLHRYSSPAAGRKPSNWNLNWFQEFAILYRRSLLNFTRERRVTVVGLSQAIIMAIIGGFVFFQLGSDQTSIQNRNGAIFFILINQSFGSLFAVLTIFHLEKFVFLRERAAGAYRVSTYYMAKTLAELPVQMMFPLLYGTLVYWLMGLNPDAGRFFTFLVLVVLTVVCAQSLGLLVSCATPNLTIANAVAPTITILFLILSGLYLNVSDVWVGFLFIQKLSFLYWGYSALMVNEYEGQTFSCGLSYYCLDTGEKVLNNVGFADVDKWFNVGILILLIVGYRFLAYLALRFLKKPQLKLA